MNIPTIGDAQASYWMGALTRAEAQKVFDEQAALILPLQQRVVKQELMIAFLMIKNDVTAEDINKWLASLEEPNDQACDTESCRNCSTNADYNPLDESVSVGQLHN